MDIDIGLQFDIEIYICFLNEYNDLLLYSSYTCSHIVFHTFVLCILEQYASQRSRVTLHYGSVNFIQQGPCALSDGFHLNRRVLYAVHLRTLDNGSILVHVTNKFHETIHNHVLGNNADHFYELVGLLDV